MSDRTFLPQALAISPRVYGEKDFVAIARLVRAETGIVLSTGKAMLVYSRLATMVRESGAVTFTEYVRRIEAEPDLRVRTIAALTTNHTFFFREAHQFRHFATQVRPALLEALYAGEPVRMWSAGCASGEETWSLGMTLLSGRRSEGLQIAAQDVLCLASDIAPHALRTACQASYATIDLKNVPRALRRAWIKIESEHAIIDLVLKDIVRFRTLNLQGEWPMLRKFAVIFCRNTMIYFDRPTRERLMLRFADALLPGGYFYIGHSERVTGPAKEHLELVGPTIYRKVA